MPDSLKCSNGHELELLVIVQDAPHRHAWRRRAEIGRVSSGTPQLAGWEHGWKLGLKETDGRGH